MSPEQQKIYDLLMEIKQDQAVFIEKHNTLSVKVGLHNDHIETMKADRNKFLGVAWVGGLLGGLGFFGALGALIMSWFKH